MRSVEFSAISAVDGTTNPASAAIETNQWFMFSVQALGTGTIAGAMKVQGSNDPGSNLGVNTPTHWVDIPTVTVTLAALIGIIPATNCAYNWIRIVFTSSGGAGNITALVKGNSY